MVHQSKPQLIGLCIFLLEAHYLVLRKIKNDEYFQLVHLIMPECDQGKENSSIATIAYMVTL